MRHIRLFEGYMEPEYYQVDWHTDLPPVVSMSDRTIEQIIKIMGARYQAMPDAEKNDPWKWSENNFICEKKPDRNRLIVSFQYGTPYDGIKFCKLSGIDLHSGHDKPISDSVGYINISQGEDDWFRIAYGGKDGIRWFKCDQTEGLVKFLKDKDII